MYNDIAFIFPTTDFIPVFPKNLIAYSAITLTPD